MLTFSQEFIFTQTFSSTECASVKYSLNFKCERTTSANSLKMQYFLGGQDKIICSFSYGYSNKIIKIDK